MEVYCIYYVVKCGIMYLVRDNLQNIWLFVHDIFLACILIVYYCILNTRIHSITKYDLNMQLMKSRLYDK